MLEWAFNKVRGISECAITISTSFLCHEIFKAIHTSQNDGHATPAAASAVLITNESEM